MKQPMTKIDQILELCADSGIEIVSYGLAPNPNGFCFESCDDSTEREVKQMNDLLESLSTKEENVLRAQLFGKGA